MLLTSRSCRRLRRIRRRSGLVGLGLALAVPVLPVASGTATAAGPSSVALRSRDARASDARTVVAGRGRVLTVRGRGFGHGHGMSQYGAWGAARAGLDHAAILAFYYPGTVPATVSGDIRVRIIADTTRDLVVGAVGGLTLRDLGTRTTYPLPLLPGVTRWRLDVEGTVTVVDSWSDGGWHRYQPGGLAALSGDGELTAPVPLTLWTPSGTATYRGALRAASPTPGSTDRDTVDVLSLDDYVRGVISAEMPTSWSPEAVQAQAVATRTYATWSRDQAPDRSWQICDTSACQVYRGVAAEDARADAAVQATAGQILTYGGQPAFTQFGASNGGWTSVGSRPYLTARADPYDGTSVNPLRVWTVRLSAARVRAAYPQIGKLRRLVVTRRDGHGRWGGRVLAIRLDGSRRDVTLSGEAFRAAFGLRSTWFRV